MAARPWYKRFGADFIHGSLGLSLEEKGAYSICLDLIYDRGGPIPDDARWLAAVCGITVRKWQGIRSQLIAKEKLVLRRDGLSNARAEKEIELAGKLAEKHAENGAKGGKSRSLREVDLNDDNGLAEASLKHRAGEDARIQKPESSLRSPRVAGEDRTRTVPASAPESGEPGGSSRGRWRPVDELGVVLDAERAAAVVEHRARLRKPLTAHGARLLAQKLAGAGDPRAAADAMIANGWAGFEPSWLEGRAVRPRAPPGAPANGFLALHRRLNGHADDDQPFDAKPAAAAGGTAVRRPAGPARS